MASYELFSLKATEITTKILREYLNVDESDKLLWSFYMSALSFVSQYTGLPLPTTTEDGETTVGNESYKVTYPPASPITIDSYPELAIAVLAVTQDFYDNRGLNLESYVPNATVKTILDMHSRNYL